MQPHVAVWSEIGRERGLRYPPTADPEPHMWLSIIHSSPNAILKCAEPMIGTVIPFPPFRGCAKMSICYKSRGYPAMNEGLSIDCVCHLALASEGREVFSKHFLLT
jgi:hypothetical protein